MHLKPLHLLLALSFFLFDLVLSLPLSGYYDAIDNSSSLPALLAQSYDYIIVGGGNCTPSLAAFTSCKPADLSLIPHLTTAGLALASRLSSTPSLTILVLEAGTRFVHPCPSPCPLPPSLTPSPSRRRCAQANLQPRHLHPRSSRINFSISYRLVILYRTSRECEW